ncbi:hypothetical protein [Vibrio sp. 10N.239.312.D08]|uniref:hypothetical protein n=1 Tax=Vibrio sp. 10N.239.312.D08 TaxID=3229978 RepID=UPI00354D951B
MTNLTHAKIDEVTSKIKSALIYKQKDSIEKVNITYLQKLLSDQLKDMVSKKEPVGPLVDALEQGSIKVTGADTSKGSTCAGYPSWELCLEFPEFEMLLTWLEDPAPGEGNMDETVVMVSCNDVTDVERENIEFIFGNFCDQICNDVVYSCNSLIDTPEKPTDISDEDFFAAEQFFSTFGQQSQFWSVTTSVRVSDSTFESTYLVEAKDAPEATINLLRYLEPCANEIVEHDGEYYTRSCSKCYEWVEASSLSQFDFENQKSSGIPIVTRDNLVELDAKDVEVTYIKANELQIETLKNEMPLGKQTDAHKYFVQFTELLGEDIREPNLHIPPRVQDVVDTAQTLQREHEAFIGKCVIFGDVDKEETVKAHRFTVHLPMFDHLVELASDTSKFVFEDENTVVFDLNDSGVNSEELTHYLGQLNHQLVIINNYSK